MSSIVWVVRDRRYNDNEPEKQAKDCMYMLFSRRPELSHYGWFAKNTGQIVATINPRRWNSITDKTLHLKPGEGPIPVSIELHMA